MSGSRDNRAVTYLTDDEIAGLKAWSDETGKSVSNLIREAVREYLDHDRNDRIERQLAQLNDRVEEVHALVENSEHTRTNSALSSGGSDTVEKAREIHRRISNNHEPVVKDEPVTRAIEDIAGADPRTVDKYKAVLKRRLLLFKHPHSAVWTVDRKQWLEWCQQNIDHNPELSVGDVVDGYDLTKQEYAELVGDDPTEAEYIETVEADR